MGQYNNFSTHHGAVGISGSAVDTKVSPALDTKAMEQAVAILVAGLSTATGDLQVKIEHSPDNSVWADLTGAVFTTLVGVGDDEQVLYGIIKCNQVGVDRYLRISATVAVDTFDYGCTMLSMNLSGDHPVVTNALPTPVFDILPPT